MKYYYIENESERVNYCITDESDDIITISKTEKKSLSESDLTKQTSFYECYDLYPDELSIKEKLLLFRKDFNQWSKEIEELYPESNYNHCNPKNYFTNNIMVTALFKKYSSKILKKYSIPSIGRLEASYQEKTHNGGLTYLKETGLYKNTYGYDLSSCYANFLGNKDLEFCFPINEGYQFKYSSVEELKELYKKKKLLFGYYNIKITSEHPDVNKIFAFSVDNVYVSDQLIFCFKYRQLYKFKFELDLDNTYNCYIYKKQDVIESHEIFGNWFEVVVKDFKTKLPKNKIVKHLSSSLWGQLIKFNRYFITEDELLERIDIGRSMDDDKPYYHFKHHNEYSIEIFDKAHIYSNNMARIKSFLTSKVRIYMAELIIKNKLHNNLIRVQIDSLVLDKPFDFTESYKPIPEDKTTGTMFFVNLNDYYHQCSQCNQFYKFVKTGCVNCSLLSAS